MLRNWLYVLASLLMVACLPFGRDVQYLAAGQPAARIGHERESLPRTQAGPADWFERGGSEAVANAVDRPHLKVDPGERLTASTFFGGPAYDSVHDVVLDAEGFVYVVGSSGPFDSVPATPGVVQPHPAGSLDAFVAKFTPDARELVFCSYFGGSEFDTGQSVALGGDGRIFVAGTTLSTDLPGASGEPGQSPCPRCFLASLSPDASAVNFSVIFGGTGEEFVTQIGVGVNGSIFATGFTRSADFPLVDPVQPELLGPSDAFLAELSGEDGRLRFSTYYGGSGDEGCYDLFLNDSACAIVGVTSSPDLRVPSDLDRTFDGETAGFVALVDQSSHELVGATYFGGVGGDALGCGAFLPNGDDVLAGSTEGDFPLLDGGLRFGSRGGRGDAVVAVVSADLSSLRWATTFGGRRLEGANDLDLSATGVVVGGVTTSDDFPTRRGAFRAFGGGEGFDGFVAAFDLEGNLLRATYLGGHKSDSVSAVKFRDDGSAVAAGTTASKDFPTKRALQPEIGRRRGLQKQDGFLALLP